MSDLTTDPPQILHGPPVRHRIEGIFRYFAPGVPVLEPEAPSFLVPPEPVDGEFGAIEFARDLGVWLGRLFDQPVDRIGYRENPWDHRPCPRAQSSEIHVADHTILVISYDRLLPGHRTTHTAHAVFVDDRLVPRSPDPYPRQPAWHLAWIAWEAATCQP